MENQAKKVNVQKRTTFDPTKKLNVMKIDMTQLEWYKKDSKNRNIGYYDRYKKMLSANVFSTSDQDVFKFRRNLTNYWKNMVEEAELKPQKEGAAFRIRWIYGGTNYRRLVEPLDIADYYTNGGKNYKTEGRSRHYIQLEEWLEEEKKTTSGSNSTSTKNVETIFTFDSCFWAHVEEALLSNEMVKDAKSSVPQKEEEKGKLLKFQEYVYGLLKKYEVSSDIFLQESSYMIWWDEHKEIDGARHHSELARFMSNADNYNVRYVRGTYKFS